MIKKALILSFLCLTLWSYGQVNSIYPDVVTSYKGQEVWINPSSSMDTSQYYANMVANYRAGNRGNVGLYQLDAGVHFLSGNKNNQVIRVLFSSEKEGPYISKPRGYINYGFRLALNKKLSLSSGIAYGFSSNNIQVAQVSNVNSYFVQDGAFGLELTTSKWGIGAAMMHVFNNQISEQVDSIRLNRFYHINAFQLINFNQQMRLELRGFYRLFSDLNNQLLVNALFYPLPEFGFGGSYFSRKGMSFSSYFQMTLRKTTCQLFMSYNSGWMAEVPAFARSFELGMKLWVD